MKKFSQKQTKLEGNTVTEKSAMEIKATFHKGRKQSEKFVGRSGQLQILEPVIIPGYKIRG